MQFSIRDAIVQGYTVEVYATSDGGDLELMTKPDTDFDDTFRAYDINSQEWLDVNGWLFIVEPVDAGEEPVDLCSSPTGHSWVVRDDNEEISYCEFCGADGNA